MSTPNKPTELERQQYEAAVERFLDLLARLIAREPLRQSAAAGSEKDDGADKKPSAGETARLKKGRK